MLKLPHSVLWAPGDPTVDLDEPGGRELAYRAVLAEGTVEDLVQILNRDQLIVVWAELLLPHRLREMWEARFVELQSNTPV